MKSNLGIETTLTDPETPLTEKWRAELKYYRSEGNTVCSDEETVSWPSYQPDPSISMKINLRQSSDIVLLLWYCRIVKASLLAYGDDITSSWLAVVEINRPRYRRYDGNVDLAVLYGDLSQLPGASGLGGMQAAYHRRRQSPSRSGGGGEGAENIARNLWKLAAAAAALGGTKAAVSEAA